MAKNNSDTGKEKVLTGNFSMIKKCSSNPKPKTPKPQNIIPPSQKSSNSSSSNGK